MGQPLEISLKREKAHNCEYEGILLCGDMRKVGWARSIGFLFGLSFRASGGERLFFCCTGYRGIGRQLENHLRRWPGERVSLSVRNVSFWGIRSEHLAGFVLRRDLLDVAARTVARLWDEEWISCWMVTAAEGVENVRDLQALVRTRTLPDEDLLWRGRRNFVIFAMCRFNIMFSWKCPRPEALAAVKALVSELEFPADIEVL